jgi:transcription initiation factor TFIIH subunit 4
MEQLLKYIRKQPEEIVLQIVSDEEACRTYIKLLKPLAQQILFRLLLIPNGFPASEIMKWSSNVNLIGDAYTELSSSYITKVTYAPNGTCFVKINDQIRNNLLGLGQSGKMNLQESKPKISTPFLLNSSQKSEDLTVDADNYPIVPEDVLDEFAKSQLESILSYLLSLRDKNDPETNKSDPESLQIDTETVDVDPDTIKILQDAGLIEYGNHLVAYGHRFLLMNPKKQIWRIVKTYLNSTKDVVSALKFILKIGSMQLTHGYPISVLPSLLAALLDPFRAVGLVYIKGNFFYPTKSILNFFGKSDIFKKEGWMFIDTNFKITAFPKSNLEAKLLKKFAIVTYEFPGFISAFISPKSFRDALDKGTTLNDIISFLNANLSKSIGSGTIPETVQMQLHAWRDQRERIQVTPNCVMRQYNDKNLAFRAAEIAKGFDVWKFGPMYIEMSRFSIVVTSRENDEEYKRLLEYDSEMNIGVY